MDLIVNNGKVGEPSKLKKIMAKLGGNEELNILLSHKDIQQMIVTKMSLETPWLSKYTHGSLDFDTKTNSFIITFTIQKGEENESK